MLDVEFSNVYTKFKLHFYQKVFSRIQDREASLTTVEAFWRSSTPWASPPSMSSPASSTSRPPTPPTR